MGAVVLAMSVVQISVIIATYNRVERLHACLQALSRQTASADSFEVIVVIDGSTDATHALLNRYAAPYSLTVIHQQNAGQPAALNRGLAEAIGHHCLFLDDDIVAAPTLVAEHLQAHESGHPVVAVGQLKLQLPDDAGWYTRAFARAWRERYQRLNREPDALTWEDCYGGNLSAPRAALLEAGGFATSLDRGFDVELAYRLAGSGCALVYVPKALGVQDERKGPGELTRDAEQAGFVDATRFAADPDSRSAALGSLHEGRWPKRLVRRMLVALRFSPVLLVWCGNLLPLPALRHYLHSLTQNLAYWKGVRRAIGRTARWRQLAASRPAD